MISEAFQHCHGIGPSRLTQLQSRGIRTWDDVLANHEELPVSLRDGLLSECRQALGALRDDDIAFFVRRFSSSDRWRILHHYFDQATFFDIETTGLDYDARITVICTFHKGQFQTFVEHENLDDFLDVLDEARLLVSFNGSSFDVPRVLSGFHIPELPCPHIDLRWSCYHKGLRGSLKLIAETLGLKRPDDLQDADGALAVALWNDWMANQNSASRALLVRYCCADVLLLAHVARHVCGLPWEDATTDWARLPEAAQTMTGAARTALLSTVSDVLDGDLARHTASASGTGTAASADPATDRTDVPPLDRKALVSSLFGSASPGQLRTLRKRRP